LLYQQHDELKSELHGRRFVYGPDYIDSKERGVAVRLNDLNIGLGVVM
jgi:hypothetical protein